MLLPVVPAPFVVPPAAGVFPLQIADGLGLAALEKGGPIVLLWVQDPEARNAADALATVGVKATILQKAPFPGGVTQVLLQPEDRVQVREMKVEGDCLLANTLPAPYGLSDEQNDALAALFLRYAEADPAMSVAMADPSVPPLFNAFQLLPLEGSTRQEALKLDADGLVRVLTVAGEAKIGAFAGRAMETIVPAPEDAPGPVPEDDHEAFAFDVEQWARAGMSVDEIVGNLTLVGEELEPPLDEEAVGKLAEAAVARQVARAADWSRPTAAERMLSALEGIDGLLFVPAVAPGGWAEEIDDDLDMALDEAETPPEGLVFYTMGTALDAAAGNGMKLGFRAVPDNSGGCRKPIGQRVLDALENAGLPARWSGHPDDGILVDIPWHVPTP